MKILIAGCGFVGDRLCSQLMADGHEVIPLSLSGSGDTLACDLSDLDSVTNIRKKTGTFDRLVHCASSGRGGDRVQRYRDVYLNGCQNLISAFPDTPLIFTSSTSVYAQTDGQEVDEQSPAEPSAETGKVLRETEQLVIAEGGSVARLAGIYGPGRSYLLKKFLDGKAMIDGRWINQIHRDDAAAALAFLLDSPNVVGLYNVADHTPLWQLNCYEELNSRFNLPMPPEGDPDPNRKRGWTNKRVSSKKLRNLGWEPSFPSYFDALDNDPKLVSSIREQLRSE